MTERRTFPASVKLAAWNRCGGLCEGCGAKLFPGRFQYDHTVPHALGGASALENCQVLCSGTVETCHGRKTAGEDIPRIAKAKRIARKLAAPVGGKHDWPKRSMRDPRWKRRMDGTVVPR